MEQNTMKYKVKQYLMFAGVSTVLFSAVVILPFIYGLYLTFTSWDGVSKRQTICWTGKLHCYIPRMQLTGRHLDVP